MTNLSKELQNQIFINIIKLIIQKIINCGNYEKNSKD